MHTTITINPSVLELLPALRIGIMGVRAPTVREDATRELVLAAAAKVRAEDDEGNIAADRAVDSWRKTYGAMGLKPSKFRSSIESLIRRAYKAADMSTGIPLVDLYNAVSLSTRVPFGGYDFEKVSGAQIDLRFADPSADVFDPLGGSSESFPIKPGLVVYAINNNILCWAINSRDAKRSCIDKETETALFFAESVVDERELSVENAMDKLRAVASSIGLQCTPTFTISKSIDSVKIEM